MNYDGNCYQETGQDSCSSSTVVVDSGPEFLCISLRAVWPCLTIIVIGSTNIPSDCVFQWKLLT